ncbi:GH3 auxin-responsive promoter [Arenibacter sp. H213]|uniref:GH3 auxin-responsive promoter family protein n=1 Tax=Arenibacter antarcticus TaxID=2040469 RepID=A0ABW5VDW3_9FLAO|nr:GH3 auxin-responsive promoter family protein [Arenibacter sp. H213]MCM4168601.1 GH3 auxin-responsive promoter [Arenibacter sp. H213]
MPIVGSIVKGFLDLRGQLVSDKNPVDSQKEVLQMLLEKAKNTAFGMHYNFTEILESSELEKTFSERIPYFDYDKMDAEWWSKIHEGSNDVSWPGNPDYFALSSGTTGKTSKRIPVTNQMIKAIQEAGLEQVYALSNFDLPADFFEKDIMMLGSSTALDNVDEHMEGEISGISASKIPAWFRGYYKPGEEISEIDDWDERIDRIVEKATEWDIGALSGIPSWMELMLKQVIERHNLKNIHDLWPNLQVYTSGGVAFSPYKRSFNALLGKPITVIDTYLASEGFIAFQARPETNAMQLVTNGGIYFEFVPFKPEYIDQNGALVKDAPSVPLSEVKLHQDYVLIISTVSGAWRYIIGDTIEFTDVERAEIKITGRTKFFLNVVGSQLSVNKMDDAVNHLEDQFSIKIPEYTICAKKIEGEFYHCWYLGTDGSAAEGEIVDCLDSYLKSANKNYKVARSKALKGVKATLVPISIFHDWSAYNKNKGGQVKMERVMDEGKFQEWEHFAQKKIS